MVSFGRRHQRQDGPAAADEDPVVRQYRFLLREASPDAVEVAHTEALRGLDEGQRGSILSAVQQGLVAGQRLQPGDIDQIAHLIVLGERRTPNAFLSACEPVALRSLSDAVITSEASFGLLGRYAAWDGKDPEPEDQSDWSDSGFDPDSGRWNPARKPNRSWENLPGGGMGGGVPDGGGGF